MENQVSESSPRKRVEATRSSMLEWHLDSRRQYEVFHNRGVSADKILRLSDSVRDNVHEVILHNKKETEMRLEERISDIQEAKVELEQIGALIQNELEILELLRDRIRDGIKLIRGKALNISEKCMLFREERRGIDLSHDEVEKELEAEKKKLIGAEEILVKSLTQAEETMRMLRAGLYLVSKNIKEKARVLSIECDCLQTKETSLNLAKYKGGVSIDAATISLQEWKEYKNEILKSSWEKIHCARNFQVHMNPLLKEIIEDLRKQKDAVNMALQNRITEVKAAKARLQILHYEITCQINDMNQNIKELEKSIREKEAFLALAHTRLEKRAHRRGTELVEDEVQGTLVKEVVDIKQLLECLQKMSSEANVSLRSLLKTQLQLEEQINIKTQSLKIDEVDCMSVRQGIEYHDI